VGHRDHRQTAKADYPAGIVAEHQALEAALVEERCHLGPGKTQHFTELLGSPRASWR
jgi:hypothetical protein